MRPMFYGYPADERCWMVDDQYLFGDDIVVAPVVWPGATERQVFLPSGTNWTEAYTDAVHDGGRTVTAAAPLAVIPVFVRQEADRAVLEALRHFPI